MFQRIFSMLCVAILLTPGMVDAESISVLYAGSLMNLMEPGIGPAFNKATGDNFQGFAGGSNGLANEIKGQLRRGDVFISANPKVNADLIGSSNGIG